MATVTSLSKIKKYLGQNFKLPQKIESAHQKTKSE